MPAYTNAKQNIPPLFKEITRNHAETAALRNADAVVVPLAAVSNLKRLRDEMSEYRRGAERALRWNTNKGNTA
jgi:hypothetical protein